MSSTGSTEIPEKWPRNPEYQTLLDALPAAVYLCDVNGNITYFNQAAVQIWGRSPVLGKDRWCGSWKAYNCDGAILPPDRCPMAETLRTQRPVTGREVIVEQPGGRRIHVLPHPRPIFNEGGEMTGAINMFFDITAHPHYKNLKEQNEKLFNAMEALKRSEERFQKMIIEVQDYAIILLSKDGTIEKWNYGAEKIKGYSEEEVLGKHIRIFYPPEDQKQFLPERLIREAIDKGKANHEGWRIRKDGSRFWASISITALHDSTGEVIGFSKVTRDLSERREQDLRIREYAADLENKNRMLRLSEERYHRMVVEVEDYVIILLSEDGRIENWNKGAERIKGYSADEVTGRHFSIFYPEEDRNKKLPERLLEIARREGKALHEGWRIRKDGTSFWGSVVMTALHNDHGDVIGFTKVTRDLTEKKKFERKLVKTSLKLEQKNKELEQINEELASFAYISSHDLQEPLRKIQTFSDRVLELENDRLTEKGRDYLQRIHGGARRMQKLIQDLLAYSRTTTVKKKLERVDLGQVLAQSRQELEVLINEKKALVEHGPMPEIKVIPFQIQQLFTNLLSNALKFSKPGVRPHITIRTETVHAGSVPGTPSSDVKQYCHISVHDNGIGFEQEHAKKIFEVFQRLHARSEYSGTGIGLAICKKIIESHHGVIMAEGVPGNGATFHIYLPLIL